MSCRILVLCIVIAVAATRLAVGDDRHVDFNRDIRPILSNNCFRCHGPDEGERKSGLRLDVRDGAVEAADSGSIAIVSGEPQQSELIRRVSTADDSERMPPAGAGKRLSEREIALLTEWIRQGGQYAKHWSYEVPMRPNLPTVQQSDWPRNPIDHFILARLEREGVVPSLQADDYALVRRASLDLTGLPPTLPEVNEFINDDKDGAYERMIDRFMQKTAYGEHWARKWLDLARYADSAGYADDPPRVIWLYRDWVIRAINNNMPFDQFTIQQLAGDLLSDPREEHLIATAFHRNTLTNNEGGTNDEEYRNVAIVDRVNTTMAVWMGTTMACAQCHTHKYDPISQEEYFRMFAVFNNSQDADRRDESPVLLKLSDTQRKQTKKLRKEIKRLEVTIQENESKRASQRDEEIPMPQGPLSSRIVRIELPGKKRFLSLAEVQVFVDGENIAPNGNASQSSTDFDGPPEFAIDGNTDGRFTAKSTTHTAADDNPWWEVDLGRNVTVERIVVFNRTDSGVGSRLSDFRVIQLNESRQPQFVESIAKSPNPNVRLAPPKLGQDLNETDRKALLAYTKDNPASKSPEKLQLEKLRKQLAAIKGVPTPIMRELPSDKRRTTHIQHRGNFLDRGKEVTAGLPTALGPSIDGDIDRLTLARWLIDERNPLTARVIANRYWEAIFGVGLVRTSEEFGAQGELPSHPQLLDWLATELIRLDWDTKAFVKLLVTSSAYRQSSRVTPQMFERDPENRLLARGPRIRLSAEMIRDQALAVSGLLSDKLYGPPVNPPQPKLGLNAAFGGGIDWTTSEGEDRYRRGLYTTWRRSSPYPSMATFDAPNREVCTVRRDRTNTPLQALVTLNDPVYVEAAQALGRRMDAAGPSLADKVEYGFRLCLARPPSDDELHHLIELFQRARERFADDAKAAEIFATTPIGPIPDGSNAADLAAWTVVGNVLLNLDEMFMKR